MKTTVRQKSLLFSFISLLFIGSLSYAIFKSVRSLLGTSKLVEHTELVIYQSGAILSLSKDIETATRGFVITGDSSFLEPMFRAGKIIFVSVGQLKQLTADNPSQQPLIDSLQRYIQKSVDFSNQVIAVRNKEGAAASIALIAAGKGNTLSFRIRQVTDAIEHKENILLEQRKLQSVRSVALFNRFSVAICVLIGLFVVLLLVATSNYFLQNKEKEKRGRELIMANKELAFQNEERHKRAAELIIANEELVFQNTEKENRAAELVIANKELVFQNTEKENRAAELVIANKELAFQNKEKGDRAAELIVANKELVFQYNEKEMRAQELIVANKELVFQNTEKEKRAAELIAVNKELKTAEDGIHKLNEELEQKVKERTVQLETVNKDLESFSYSVSHDLRAPIRAINGYALILMEDYGKKFDEEGALALDSIVSNSNKMGTLIDDLLAFSKLGRKQVSVSDIDMNILVKAVMDDILPGSNDSHMELNIKELLPAKGDPSLIKQVWINLISNAVKYSRHKPEINIEIGSYKKDQLVVYYVKDHGAGFDMQYYNKLFGVFQRLHSQEEFEGTGIGLAIVQKVIHRHNGTVWAESKVNEGTCFYFSLPGITIPKLTAIL